MNKLIAKILEESKKKKKIIGIRKYNDDEEFWCGYIIDYNEDNILIQHYTKFGKPDGVINERICDIESFDTDNDYSKSYQYLIKNNHKLDQQTSLIIELKNSDNWQFDTLQQLYSKAEVVSLEINNEDWVVGLITELNTEYINLTLIGKLGEYEGKTTYRLSDISSIHYNRMEERKRKLLYDWKNKYSK